MPGANVRELWTAIRRKCVDCSGFQPKEVRLCTVTSCDLWPYRMGKEHKVQQLRPVQKLLNITPKIVA